MLIYQDEERADHPFAPLEALWRMRGKHSMPNVLVHKVGPNMAQNAGMFGKHAYFTMIPQIVSRNFWESRENLLISPIFLENRSDFCSSSQDCMARAEKFPPAPRTARRVCSESN
ncbi:MAG: hypothetical protein IJ662_04580 [Clostridia bacterium]|nr:hypothetical protein [Clostridia bacterium]